MNAKNTEVFKADQTKEYREWIGAHTSGYVGAYRWGSHGRIHRANCWCVKRPTEKKDAVRVCSMVRSAVESWAAREKLSQVPCGHCLNFKLNRLR